MLVRVLVQVEQTNELFQESLLNHNKIEDLATLGESVDAEVITMIFSLEHVLGLRNFMGALSRNKKLRYFLLLPRMLYYI